MAIKLNPQFANVRPPSWSGGKSTCKKCSKTTHCNVGGPVPTKTDRWEDGYVFWYISACFHCGYGEQKNKYIRAAYLKRVGRFDSI